MPIALLLQLIALATKLTPIVLQEIEGIKAQTGKTADQIFDEAGVKFAANDVKALALLAKIAAS